MHPFARHAWYWAEKSSSQTNNGQDQSCWPLHEFPLHWEGELPHRGLDTGESNKKEMQYLDISTMAPANWLLLVMNWASNWSSVNYTGTCTSSNAMCKQQHTAENSHVEYCTLQGIFPIQSIIQKWMKFGTKHGKSADTGKRCYNCNRPSKTWTTRLRV